ncbi:hypothetical protein YC2023_068751 [Brassica napus]
MSRLIQNRVRNTFSRLKPSIALSSSTLTNNLSTSPEPSPEPLDESSEIWNVIIGRAGGDRVVSEDEVFHRLSNDPFCNRVNLSDTLLNKLLHRFRDDWRSALGVLKWAESRKAHKNHSAEAYDTAVDILGKAKKWDRMKAFVEKMKVDNTVTLNTVAKIMRRFAGAGEWEEAVNVFDRLNEFGLEKNTESMNLLLDTLCKEKRVERARSVLLELKAHIKPDAHTFNIFINGWCKTNRVEEALWTIQEMRGYGFRPCVISYTTIIKCYCLKSDFIKVYEMLSEMEANDSPPNSAVELLREMESLKVCEPDVHTYHPLLRSCFKRGDVVEVGRLLKEMVTKHHLSLDESTYTFLIQRFCRADMCEWAYCLFEEMISQDIAPRHRTCLLLLDEVRKKSMHEAVERIEYVMRSVKLTAPVK